VIRPVANREELLEAFERVRRAGGAPTTNWFAAPERIDLWVDRNSLYLREDERALVILRRDGEFHRVYHCAADLAALSAVLRSSCAELPARGVLTTDLIGRHADLDPVIAIYRESGFANHNCLIRMIRMAVPEYVAASETDVEFASPADITAVAEFLRRLLDPYTDQIPDENEIREAAARGNLLLVRSGQSVHGLLLFEPMGLTSHLRYWYVDDAARNRGIGARLIRQFFHLSRGSKRLILWVVGDNADSIARYRHYGFRADALVDRIMIRR
jgi:GNAT superfamily N-acetyltransferase